MAPTFSQFHLQLWLDNFFNVPSLKVSNTIITIHPVLWDINSVITHTAITIHLQSTVLCSHKSDQPIKVLDTSLVNLFLQQKNKLGLGLSLESILCWANQDTLHDGNPACVYYTDNNHVFSANSGDKNKLKTLIPGYRLLLVWCVVLALFWHFPCFVHSSGVTTRLEKCVWPSVKQQHLSSVWHFGRYHL